MDEKGFRAFIKEGKRVAKNLPEKTIRANIRAVKEFETFLKKGGKSKDFSKARVGDVKKYLAFKASKGEGSFDEYLGLIRYARFCGNETAELALVYALDGANVIGDLCDAIKDKHGRRGYALAFEGFERPPIGTSPKKMPSITTDFMNRLEGGFGEEEAREILLIGVHAGPPEYYGHEKKMLEESKDIDEYLRKRREKFIEELQGHADSGTLFFDQRIDEDVMEFVRKNPEVAGGVRKGGKIYQTKIPYRAIEYLRTKDSKMKRYYGCHCPLARESILSGKEMSRNLCYCSAGYEKRPFEVAFGKPVKTKVLKSILWGDETCRFAMEIPEEHLPKKK